MLAATEFADWVLGIVGVAVLGGVASMIKVTIDVQVIKQMLRHGDNRFANLETRVSDVDVRVKRHSDRIRDLENPPSKPDLKPRRA